ncbi:vegetative incompatibility het-e-1 [Fusarium napiforme]|uniref:Vegetative incompatibility het-e-1 n=1 Tax=Fusarium napiforme TaxID=42672 RepID=A0A8H5J5B5_9HYPO|nr:vegetative incompatibility het-e-1 [Fusarium napiforme]
MRLINSRTLRLEESYGAATFKKYAILSHTWGADGDEVTFQDWQDPRVAATKLGYHKVIKACAMAQKHDLDYIWIDSCCIDKSSSAELSEAINSMYVWYRDAEICYAYLADVSPSEGKLGYQPEELRNSRWFTRGWTLQELLAPRKLWFYSCDWTKLGTKKSLANEVSAITGIDIPHLTMERPISSASIAKRMCWLSRRTTKRIEDLGYCMLGVFDINMPLLYGEGGKAFTRLQEELIRVSNDQTLFCWTWIDSVIPTGWTSILAPCPAVFEFSAKYVECPSLEGEVCSYTATNAGLNIKLPILQAWSFDLGGLNARLESQGSWRSCAIPLADSSSNGILERVPFPPEPISLPRSWRGSKKQIYIRSRATLGLNPELINPYRTPTESHFLITFEDRRRFEGIHAFPKEAFLRDTSSVILLPSSALQQTPDEDTRGALIRLGVEVFDNLPAASSSVVWVTIFLGCKTRLESNCKPKSLLFCQIVPDKIQTHRRPDILLSDLLRQTRKRKKPSPFHHLDEIGLSISLGRELTAGSRIASAYLCFGNNLKTVTLDGSEESDNDSDAASITGTFTGIDRHEWRSDPLLL